MTLTIVNQTFVDNEGRTVILRGINLAGNVKYPAKPKGYTQINTDFHDHADVSYVGHPLPLNEAEEHFKRLKNWGFNYIRFLVSWEAIEHKGPGNYDQEYLDYVEKLLAIAAKYEFYITIDPHQDVWSRMSGGDGAPGWTFEKAGLDILKLDKSEAACTMQIRFKAEDPKSFPFMYWNGNNYRYANSAMCTLFYGGKIFAPTVKVDNQSIQDYLQSHYINAMKELASHLKNNSMIFGFAPINEPSPGFIGILMDGSNNRKSLDDTIGHAFTPIDAMVTAAGIPKLVGFREMKKFGIKEVRKDELNKEKISTFLPDHEEIWRKEGVWGMNMDNTPKIIRNDYFITPNGKNLDFYRDFLSPFIVKFSKEIRTILPGIPIIFEGNPEKIIRGNKLEFLFPPDFKNLIAGPHWYDGPTLVLKKPMLMASFDTMTNKTVLGKGNIAEMSVRQLDAIKNLSKSLNPPVPTIIEEFALPFDMNSKESYGNQIWTKQIECLSLYYDAMDANLLNSCLWHYDVENTNQWGDSWNLEDLSIWSQDQKQGRAVEGFCRPYLMRCAGEPLKMCFNMEKGEFLCEFKSNPNISAPTIFYIPQIQYSKGYTAELSSGKTEMDPSRHLLMVTSPSEGIITLKISKK